MHRTEWNIRYKENAPQETVERIIELLHNVGLETEYKELALDTKDCYSSHVRLSNPGLHAIGSNGKGTTAEFCKASAYAELVERIQNRMFFVGTAFGSSYCDIMKKVNPVYTIKGAYQPACVQELKAKLVATAKPMPLFGKTAEDIVDDLLEKQIFGQEPGMSTVPFYAVKAQETVYLPDRLLNYFAGSNGMAAGNTLEEAIVQAVAELFERYVQLEMIAHQIVPPQIPREEIARFPIVDAIIQDIESRGPYRVYVMDCSLRQGLPVVCGAVVDTEGQTLGLKFGAHPDMGVALERVFSEAMQGKPLGMHVKMNVPDFTPPTANANTRHQNSFNMLKLGYGSIPAWILYDTPSYDFVPWQDVVGMSNHVLMQRMVAQLGSMCSDVYIRDASYLGFPSVWVYAPGVSEMTEVNMVHLKVLYLKAVCQNIFRHLDTASEEEVQQLLRLAFVQQTAILENTINDLVGIPFVAKMPFADHNEAAFLAAVCQYRLGNLSEAAKMLRSYKNLKGYDYAAQLYLTARAQGATHEEVAQVLNKLCQPHIAQKVLEDFAVPATVLAKVYPVC
ncbi:MAG: YcaO-like family protein, partial [Peptococcaceae bacterium]|nr:YcaO-like family protein [Peptococcaceae bacterium]